MAVTNWQGLLRNPGTFDLAQLIKAFQAVNLLGKDEKPTSLGLIPGAWAGALDALTQGKTAPLTINALAASKCLTDWGVQISESSLRNNTSAQATAVYKHMNQVLKDLRR